MIGNTHFDPAWLWNWPEALSSILSTFRAALARMQEHKDFHYSFSSPAVLEWVEKTDPALFEQICARVKEGRWELCEGWWVQADCNAPCGESMVRQGLYAQRYLMDRFGMTSTTVFNIDSFGHAQQLPQILRQCGIAHYVFWRPNEKHLSLKEPLFDWVGLDGSTLPTYRIGGIGGEIFTADFEKETFAPLFAEQNEDDRMVVFGVTDHGGAPTKKQMAIIDRLAAQHSDLHITYGRVDDFFADAHPSYRFDGELQVKFLGPYSNYIPVKADNRQAEGMLLASESACVLAKLLCQRPYPKDKLTQCWKDVLFNQFHDILGGACIASAYRDAKHLHGRAISTAHEECRFALQTITNRIATPGKDQDNEWNLVVFNLTGLPYTAPIEAEVQWAWEFPWYRGPLELTDENDNIIPCQIITEECVLPAFRSRFVFTAEIPPYGYRSFAIHKTECTQPTPKRRYTLSAEKEGGVTLTDQTTGQVFSHMFVPYVREDNCDTWGFNKTVYEKEHLPLTPLSFQKIEEGYYRTSYKAEYSFGHSLFTQIFRVYDDRILCEYKVLWNEERKALKLGFTSRHCTASIPYGHIEREASEFEKPMAEWLKGDGYLLAADSCFAYDLDGESISLTLLRNCLFGDLRNEPLDLEREYRYMGQGETTGTLLFYPGEDALATYSLNHPVFTLLEANHPGTLPPCDSFFSCRGGMITAVKQQENGDGVIIRLFESQGKDTTATLQIADKTYPVKLHAFEIATLLFDGEQIQKTNMLEQISGE